MQQTTTIKDFRSIILDKGTRGVLLDFDNCLYIYEPCHQAALLSVKTELEKMVGKIDNFFELYKIAQSRVKARVHGQASSHSRILYFQAMFEYLGNGSMIKESLLLERLYWGEFMEGMHLVDGVHEFLSECRKNKIKIVIISDLTASIQFEKLVKLGINHLVDFMVTSEEAGAEKPDEKIFRLALEKAGLKIEDVVMVGDNLHKDIGGAQELGIKTLYIIHE